jgi:DNA-binding MarR family transcriptional regulator
MSEPDEVADLGMAKALANPLRQRILRELERLGEATSTTLAEQIGVTTGGTSYNLRILARYGLVEEVPERAHGRERWWRHARKSVRFARRSEQSEPMRDAMDGLLQTWFAEDAEVFARLRARTDLGEWSDAMPFSRGAIHVSQEQLAAFFDDYLALLRKYQLPPGQPPPGVRRVLTRFVAFPDPGDTIEEDIQD